MLIEVDSLLHVRDPDLFQNQVHRRIDNGKIYQLPDNVYAMQGD